jgi:immune inhibitor A
MRMTARRTGVGAVSLAVLVGLAASPAVTAQAVTGSGSAPQQAAAATKAAPDELPNAFEDKRRALRSEALQDVLKGTRKAERRGASTVVNLGKADAAPGASLKAGGKAARTAKTRYVELSREKTDKVFVVLAEFGDKRDPNYPDKDQDPTIPGPKTWNGPLINQIPQPDRNVDNSTVWQPSFDKAHFQQLYFGEGKGVESLKTYYEKQSSGRYSVDGQVSDWVKVPYNEARYGRSNGYPCGGNVCSNTHALIADALVAWTADQKAKGRTDNQIKADLASYDEWDRYDFDGDGNFNEPDGYIDHFQIVHAGGDQANGDEQQGEDAIWSHRWYAFQNTVSGPPQNKLGGAPVGNTGLWVGDYTIQPENGGSNVFFHEYGHDLGLPDHYDTSGLPSQNPVNWWTIMAQSRVGAKGDQGIGLHGADLGAWDKLQLGWLDYETVVAGQDKKIDLGPHEYNSTKAQGAVVVLPKKQVTSTLVPPAAGAKSWWSTSGNDLNTAMSRSVTLPAGAPATLSFQANWDIEDCGPDACDYAFVEVNDGSGFKAIPGSITTATEGNGIDGVSGGWKPATFNLSAYAGKTVDVRFHYLTDGAAGGKGFFADEITLTSGTTTLVTDGAESGANGWTLSGFQAVGATITRSYDNYYVASNRTYTSYDKYLETGPYNFGFASKPDYVEHFPYQDGLLVTYWDTSQNDNETAVHPGSGLILPIDANPQTRYNLTGKPWRSTVQGYDATFGLQKSDSFTLHVADQPSYVRGQAAQPLFDDTKPYWFADNPTYGVKLPAAGVKIKVLQQKGTQMKVRVFS